MYSLKKTDARLDVLNMMCYHPKDRIFGFSKRRRYESKKTQPQIGRNFVAGGRDAFGLQSIGFDGPRRDCHVDDANRTVRDPALGG
jgi:hypothetical protein